MTEEAATFGERLKAAMGEVAYLEKGGYNAHFKYSFLQEAAVKRAVSEALRKHGLMVRSVGYKPIGDCSGKAACIQCTLTIADTKGTDCVVYEGVGAGADSSDKAPMKAMAAALKYALTSGFLIATGDDPEEDGGSKESGKKDAPAKKAAATEEPAKADPAEAVNEMAAKVDACATLEDLSKLKVAVSKLRGEPGFDGLATAFKEKGAALKAAATKEAA